METVKNFKEFSNGNTSNKLLKDFYDAIDWCLYKNYADIELGDDGPVTEVEVEDDELYCVVKGYEDERDLIKKIMVMFHSYAAADVFFITDSGNIPFEKVVNLQELTNRMFEVYKG